MGKLKGHIVYLSGPMDQVADGGEIWRKLVTPRFYALGMGVLDPSNKASLESNLMEDFSFRAKLDQLKEEERWDEVEALAKPVVGYDLRCVHRSDCTMLYINHEFMFGTTVEFTWGVMQRKPIIIVCEGGKKKVPGFAWGMTPHEMMFGTFDEAFAYLDRVDKGLEPDLRRWQLFDFDKIYGRKNVEHT